MVWCLGPKIEKRTLAAGDNWFCFNFCFFFRVSVESLVIFSNRWQVHWIDLSGVFSFNLTTLCSSRLCPKSISVWNYGCWFYFWFFHEEHQVRGHECICWLRTKCFYISRELQNLPPIMSLLQLLSSKSHLVCVIF
jgi:hypothetical protein